MNPVIIAVELKNPKSPQKPPLISLCKKDRLQKAHTILPPRNGVIKKPAKKPYLIGTGFTNLCQFILNLSGTKRLRYSGKAPAGHKRPQ
ncbi:hypothetical protein UF75_5056 [Desulfosporosinus sp. I2]|nr:hypothetical protein UF75_5056 [Desulfosporosinus sp. I2]